MTKRVLILGAAGRDFHNFNTYYRGNTEFDVVAFTAAQIPDIDGRVYPPELAGPGYPNGIPIRAEADMETIIREQKVDCVVFAYSDVTHQTVMHLASRALAAGANFALLGPNGTQVKSTKPVISVCAVRTGSGKSQTSRYICDLLKKHGKKVVAIRHPMPYGDLVAQRVQRFATLADLDLHKCTIEEREEYEPHIMNDEVVYAGVDYEAILREAEKEADVILWDGGNNDFSFYKSDLRIVVADPHRPGHELLYHPGETNIRSADVIIINKIDTADAKNIELVKRNIAKLNPKAVVIEAASPVTVDKPELITGKRVLVVEDGPTLTHGEMKYGAGIVAAEKYGAKEYVDPRPYTVGTITETFAKYPEIGTLLPAMGYGDAQVRDLEATINATDCDVVLSATPIDIARLVKVNKPIVRAEYSLAERVTGQLAVQLKRFF